MKTSWQEWSKKHVYHQKNCSLPKTMIFFSRQLQTELFCLITVKLDRSHSQWKLIWGETSRYAKVANGNRSLCPFAAVYCSQILDFISHPFHDSLPLIAHFNGKTCFWFQKKIYHITITYRHKWLLYEKKVLFPKVIIWNCLNSFNLYTFHYF